MSSPVFLDASFWIVYRDDEEAAHSLAVRIMNNLLRHRTPFVTTLPVVCEIHAYFTRDLLQRESVLRDFFTNPLITIEEILRQDQKAALEILQIHRDKTYSLCDALSFMVMRRTNLKRAVTFDNHFKQFGEFEIIS